MAEQHEKEGAVGGPLCTCGHRMLAHHWTRAEGYLQCCALDHRIKDKYNKATCGCLKFEAESEAVA